jgi:hypothetical protein
VTLAGRRYIVCRNLDEMKIKSAPDPSGHKPADRLGP